MSRTRSERPPTARNSFQRRPAVALALLGSALFALGFGLWIALSGGASDRALVEAEDADPSAGERARVDLALDAAPPSRSTERSATSSEEVDAASTGARAAEDASRTALDPAPTPGDSTLAPAADSEQRTTGARATLALVVTYPGQIPSPRLPAWLELERPSNDSPTLRVLGTIVGERWRFVVEDLEPGRYEWIVRTGIASPLSGRAALDLGRNSVRVQLVDLPATTVTFAAQFPWQEANSLEAAPAAVREPPAFGAAPPWLVLAGATPDDAVLVPFLDWHRAHWDVRRPDAPPSEGPFERRALVFGADGRRPAPGLVGGLPSTHDAVIAGEPGGLRVEVEAAASDRAERVLDLDVHWPAELDRDDVPAAVDVVLYGSVPEDLGALDDLDGPRQYEQRHVELSDAGSGASTGTLRFDPHALPRGLRAMVRAQGHAPIFADLDAALVAGVLEVEFRPGAGGVVLAAYQNHRMPGAHWAPGYGVACHWLPDSALIERDGAGLPSKDLLEPRFAAPMGWIEFQSPIARTFDAEHIVLLEPHPNAARTARSIHPVLACTVRDAAAGVVELFVQD